MAQEHDSMVDTPIEDLLEAAGSKFSLVTLGAMRAREINAYFGQLGEGLGRMVPPQVASVARKPLTIALEEIAAGKIVAIEPPEVPDPVEEIDVLGDSAAAADAASADEASTDKA